jgi:hypothetical protein
MLAPLHRDLLFIDCDYILCRKRVQGLHEASPRISSTGKVSDENQKNLYITFNFSIQPKSYFRTVLMEDIPFNMRSPSVLRSYLTLLYPNSKMNVQLCVEDSYLLELIKRREYVLRKLERCLYHLYSKSKRSLVQVGISNEATDAIDYYTNALKILNSSIKLEQIRLTKLVQQETDREDTKDVHVSDYLNLTKIPTIDQSSSSAGFAHKRKSQTQADRGIDLAPIAEDEFQEGDSDLLAEEEVFRSSERDLSWYRYIQRIWRSNSFSECMYYLQSGRKVKDELISERLRGEATPLLPVTTPVSESKKFLSKAFITFESYHSATIAKQVIHMQKAGKLSTSEAPGPSDIIWDNVYNSRRLSVLKHFFIEVSVFILTIAWVAPVALISSSVTKERLHELFPTLKLSQYSTFFESLVEIFRPSLLAFMMSLVLPVFSLLAIYEGSVSYSEAQFRTFYRYFTFQIVNVFLVSTFAGSVLDSLHEVYLHPFSAFRLLGTSLPKMGGFFTYYILVKAFTGLGFELLRVSDLFSAAMKYIFTQNLTPREKLDVYFFGSIRAIDNPDSFAYGAVYAQDILVFLICATYSSITPLTLISGIAYFSLAIVVFKHQLLYCYRAVFDTGGKWWPLTARSLIIALLFAQATMIGMFVLKEAYGPIYCTIILIIFTCTYYWYISSIYIPLAIQLPLDIAMSMDQDMVEENIEETKEKFSQEFLQLTLKAPEESPLTSNASH